MKCRSAAFGVYLHTPFCAHKCSYCDFYSFAKEDPAEYRRLADSLVAEIADAAAWLEREWGYVRPATSVFFGGGTPSLLPADELARIFGAVTWYFGFAKGAEVTIEANPETVTDEVVEGILQRTPVNRVSLGAQSFSPGLLKKLERRGSPDSIRAAARTLRRHGVENFNLDLIFGIPGQDRAAMLRDIDEAAALGPRHVSFYSLTLKPGHALFSELPDDDFAADAYESGVERLAAAGYAQYEISNFAVPGEESRHNLLYWSGGDYLGVGPSAASRFFRDGRFLHRKQVADLAKYLERPPFPAPGFETTTGEQTRLEATFLELRLNAGVSAREFADRYGADLTRAPKYEAFLKEGFLELADGRVRLTPRGRLLADSVTRDLAV